jgi:hypothetical protein
MSLVSVPRTDPVKASFVTEAEKILAKAVKQGDFDKGFAVINELYEQAETFTQIIGAGLDMLENAWDKFRHEEGDSFLDAAIRKTRLNPITIRNRINVRKLLNSDRIPELYFEEVASLGQKALIRIANTVHGGYEIEKNEWEKLATSISEQQVDSICRSVEGKPPRSNFVGLYYKKNGELLAFVDGELVVLGQLVMDKDPKVVKAREVLIARAKILDRVEY